MAPFDIAPTALISFGVQDTAGDHHVDGKIEQAALLDETDRERRLRADDRGRRDKAHAARHGREGTASRQKPVTLALRHLDLPFRSRLLSSQQPLCRRLDP